MDTDLTMNVEAMVPSFMAIGEALSRAAKLDMEDKESDWSNDLLCAVRALHDAKAEFIKAAKHLKEIVDDLNAMSRTW